MAKYLSVVVEEDDFVRVALVVLSVGGSDSNTNNII